MTYSPPVSMSVKTPTFKVSYKGGEGEVKPVRE